MQLSIIIVNYNVKFFLEHCLLSVLNAGKNISFEIIVVDNNSTDGSKEYLPNKFPSVNFLWNSVNLGFGKANNLAISIAKGKYVLFLNPDTILPEDCFEKCISFFQQNKDCGAAGVRMIDGGGNFLKESKRCLPTPLSGFNKMIGLAGTFPKSPFFAKYYSGHLPEKENNKVEVLAGAFMMLSKKSIELTKGFDEDFFMYGEDVDLSFRITKTAFKNYYLGKITIIHFKGESTQKKDVFYFKHFYGAMKLFINKHYYTNKLKHAAVSAAIIIGKKIATCKNFLTHNNKKTDNKTIFKTLIIGEENVNKSVTRSLKKTCYSNFSFYNISCDISYEGLLDFADKNNIEAIIFCSSVNFANKDIIALMPKFSRKCKFLFFDDAATSIIGSHNKNQRGEFISIL